jgi:hypothetical protein
MPLKTKALEMDVKTVFNPADERMVTAKFLVFGDGDMKQDC